MSTLPGWLSAVGALFVIAAALGAAVAIYRTNLQATALKESEATVERLRGDISDYKRRESELVTTVTVQEAKLQSSEHRITVLEDLITKRQDDDEIRAEIASVRKVVDENVLSQLTAILQLLEGGSIA